jgi:hypothetical protein
MNTQRPEWNDANNALAGGGVSVVTLCHLRRYLAFLEARLGDSAHSELPISREIADWLDRIGSALQVEQGVLAGGTCGARDRKRLMDVLGRAFSDYRERVYAHGFSGTRTICVQRVLDLCHFGLRYIEHSIAANRRQDGLFNSYNLLELADPDGGAEVVRLPEMLEGQVAVLSSGALGPQAALDLLQRLFHSALHQPARRSFLLYPERVLPGFLAKNVVPDASVEAIPLLRDLLAAKDRSLLVRDAGGVCRFQGDFHNVADVAAALDELGKCASWAAAARRDRAAILELFETVFRHKSYTGRSGVMYGYEGLGCIYWHMVAKLLLAVQENVVRAGREGLPASVQGGLVRMYLRIRSGLGYQKPVAEFGAFPTDPYSHTPPHGGAEQPGMTGQVKEEFLARMGELGVHIESGSVCFEPVLLGADEFLASPATFRYVDVHGDPRAIPLPAASLAFTFCQVPVVYQRVPGAPWIRIAFADGTSVDRPGTALDSRLSAQLFDRGGRIDHIAVGIPDRDRGVAIDS